MGTVVSFDVRGDSEETLLVGIDRACASLHEADRVFSTWISDSPVSRFRRAEIGLADMPPEAGQVIDLCRHALELSRGWFDPWSMPGGFDPTGLVKGWAAERACRLVAASGAAAGLVNAGGDISTFGRPEPDQFWRVAVRDPVDSSRFTCVVPLAEPFAALATSGSYERGEHVLDPKSGSPARGLLSATVVGPELSFADALATGVFAAGADGLAIIEALPGYEAWCVLADELTVHTTGFKNDQPA